MSEPHYMIVSGFHNNPGHGLEWFHHVWFDTVMKYSRPKRVFVIADDNGTVPGAKGDWITLSGDLGACGAILDGRKENTLSGVSAVWMAGAWLAYINECDFISLEQDVLAFGPWVEALYEEIGNRGVICGKSRAHGIATSLYMVKHEFIPTFVKQYLNEGPETLPSRIPERKFARMEERYPELYCRFNFGYDTDRPINVMDPVWYAQKLNHAEMQEIRRAGLIHVSNIPEVKLFSNL